MRIHIRYHDGGFTWREAGPEDVYVVVPDSTIELWRAAELLIETQQRQLAALDNKVYEENACVECGVCIPQISGGHLENKWHDKTCSLFDPEKP